MLSLSIWSVFLKGSYDVAKKNIILCIWCNAMCLWFKVKKNTLFSTYCTLLLLLYALPFWNVLIFTKLIVLKREVCSDWPAVQCIVIGRIPQACDRNVTPLTVLWCDTKTIKPIINEAFVASSWDIITDYNDFYCIFTRRVALRKHYHVCICDRKNKRYSTQLKTRVWIVSGKFFK